MATIVFDTYLYVKKLRAVGFTEEQAAIQAETIAGLINEELTTKRDLSEMEQRLVSHLKELEYKLTIKLGAMMAASIAIIAALVKLL
jgi:hypothetical protein